MSNSNLVCVAVDSRYDNSMGEYQVAYYYNKKNDTVTMQGGTYCSEVHFKNCTPKQQLKASSSFMRDSNESYNYNKYLYGGRGGNTFIGCIVTLKGSRKAPNNVPLKVLDFSESVWNGRFKTSESVKVESEDNVFWVSSNCINEVVKGVKEKPFWYLSQESYNKKLTEEAAKLVTKLDENRTKHVLTANQNDESSFVAKFYKINSLFEKAQERQKRREKLQS